MKKYILILAVVFSAVSFVSFNQVETVQEAQVGLDSQEMAVLNLI